MRDGWVSRMVGWLAGWLVAQAQKGTKVSSLGGFGCVPPFWVFHMLLTKQCALRLREPMRHVMIDDEEKGERTRLLF